MIRQIHKCISLSCCLLALNFSSWAQNSEYAIDFSETSAFTVTGTSTLHGWTVQIGKMGGSPALLATDFNPGSTIEEMYFYVDIASMDGGRGSTMNSKIKTALKAEEFPKVEYRQTEPAQITAATKGEGDFQIRSKGDLIIGGVSKPVDLVLTGYKKDDQKITLSGKKDLTFSEYNITPPSAMFGQIVCGDDIQVNVNLQLQAKNQN